MARIRYIKPDFYNHEELAKASAYARLLFLGLPCHADKAGRLKDQPGRLRAVFFPYEPAVDVDELLDELVKANVAVRYQSDGVRYIAIPGFSEHQNPHAREPESTIPAPPAKKDPDKPGQARASTATMPPSTWELEGNGIGMEGNRAPSSVQQFPLKPLVAKRNLYAAYEHPRFDVPQWWHDKYVRGVSGGETKVLEFYRWLAARVERTNENTVPRNEWLDRCVKEWLAATNATPSSVASPEETRRMLEERKRAGQS